MRQGANAGITPRPQLRPENARLPFHMRVAARRDGWSEARRREAVIQSEAVRKLDLMEFWAPLCPSGRRWHNVTSDIDQGSGPLAVCAHHGGRLDELTSVAG